MRYSVRFVNEARTTKKYKMLKDVSLLVKSIAEECDMFCNNGTAYEKIRTKLEMVVDTIKRQKDFGAVPYIPFTNFTQEINGFYYKISIMFVQGESFNMNADVSKRRKMITVNFIFRELDDLVETFKDNQIFVYLKRFLLHEITHIYDDEVLDDHYSQVEGNMKNPVYAMYYLTSIDEVRANLSEIFSLHKNSKKPASYYLKELISESLVEEVYVNFVYKVYLSLIKHDKGLFTRYGQMFVKDLSNVYEYELVQKVRKVMFSHLVNGTSDKLLYDKRFQSLLYK